MCSAGVLTGAAQMTTVINQSLKIKLLWWKS